MTRRARSGSSHRLGEAACSRRPASSCSLPARSKELLRVGEPLAQRLQLGSVVGGHGSRLLGLGGAVQWYRAEAGCVRALKAQQAALELEDPGGRLLLKQGGHVVGEDAQQGQAVLDLLGVDGAGGAAGALGRPVVLELLQAALQGLGAGHGPHPARGQAEEAVEADAGRGHGQQHVPPGGAAGPGGGRVQQGLEGTGGDQHDGQQAQAPGPAPLAPLVGQVPVDGLDGPRSGRAGSGRPRCPATAPGRRWGRARGGDPGGAGAGRAAASPPPAPQPWWWLPGSPSSALPGSCHRPTGAIVAYLSKWTPNGTRAGRKSGIQTGAGEFPSRSARAPSEVPCPSSVPPGWSSSCWPSPWSPPSAGPSAPAAPLPRPGPRRPPPSRRTPTPAMTRPPPPTSTAAPPRTLRPSPPGTGSWP